MQRKAHGAQDARHIDEIDAHPSTAQRRDAPAQQFKPLLILYGRPACHLCDDMLAALEDWRGELGFEIEVRDVDADPRWRERFGSRIPVLMAGEEEICHFFLDPQKLRARLSR